MNNKSKLIAVVCFGFIYSIIFFVAYLLHTEHKYSFNIPKLQNNIIITKNPSIKTIANLSYSKYNHSASMTSIGNKLYITWYSGDEETAPNTKIMFAIAEKINGQWHTDQIKPIIDRQKFETIFKKYIHHLGNSIIYSQGKKLWIVFSSSSSGWVTSSLNIMHSEDLGKTWSTPKMIISSNILNFSTLTRGAAVALDNSRFAIPAYKEFNNLNGRWLVFDQDGNLELISEMTNDGVNLQPTVIPLSTNHALALYRQMKSSIKKVYANETTDAGVSWSKVEPTKFNNPDSSVAAIKVSNGILIAYNDSDDSKNRTNLSLAFKADNAKEFQNIYTFPNKLNGELSYPSFTLYKSSIILAFSDKANNTIRIVEIKGENSNA